MLAIVIPYYNLLFFERTLQSLEKQTNKNFKVYIGDDASPDNPKVLLQKYNVNLNIKYQRFDKNIGQNSLVHQWERCIDLTEEEDWIIILGDDDYLSENFISEFYINLPEVEQRNLKVVRFASQPVFGTTEQLAVYENPKLENSTDFLFRKFFGNGRGTLSEQVFKRDAYIKHGFKDFPLGWGVDDIAWLEFSECGDIFGINTATAFIRISEISISRKGFKSALKLDTKFTFLEYIIKNHLRKFKRKHRIPFLMHYEIMGYETKRVSFGFYSKISCGLLNHFKFYEYLKFHRRLLLKSVLCCK